MIPGLLTPQYQDIRAPLSLLGMQTPQAVAGPAPTPTTAQQPMWLDRMLGRALPVPEGMQSLLSGDDVTQARRNALLQFGMGLLSQSGPVVGAPAPSTGQALAHGLQAGLGGYQQSLGGAAQMSLFNEKRQQEQARAAARQEIGGSLSGPGTPAEQYQKLQSAMMRFLSIGDTESARAISEVLKSMDPHGSSGPEKLEEVIDPTTGKPAWGHVTPNGVRVIPGAAPYQAPASQPARRLIAATNPKTGKPELAQYDPATGAITYTGHTPAGTRDAAATEGERKAGVLYMIAAPSSEELDAFDAPDRVSQLASGRGLQEFLSANQQLLDHHAKVVSDAYIRLTSGANAPDSEFKRAFEIIAPRAGDSPALLAQKRATRRRFVRALQMAAGRSQTSQPADQTGLDSVNPTGNPLLDP